MRPTQYLPKEKYYPLLIGLLVLLLPYLWTLAVLPFRLSNYLRANSPSGEETAVEIEPTVPTTSSSISSSSTATSIARTTSKAGGLNIWKGFKELVRPKWEDPPDVEFSSATTASSKQVAGKTIRTTTTKYKTVTKPSVTTVRDQKTVTRSFTEIKTFTETQTETVEIIVEKVVQTPVVIKEKPVIKEKIKLDDNSVVLDEIDVMGWHQVLFHLS